VSCLKASGQGHVSSHSLADNSGQHSNRAILTYGYLDL